MSNQKVQVTTVPGGLQALASRDSQPNIMVVYVNKHIDEDDILEKDNGDSQNLEDYTTKAVQENTGKRRRKPAPLLYISSSEEASYDSESEDSVHHVDKESSIQKKPQPSKLHDLVPWKVDTVSAPKIDEKELLSTTLNLSDVGTSLRTPRDSGTSPTSQFLERGGTDDVLQTRDDENIKAKSVSNQSKHRNQQSNKLKKVNSALKQSPKSTNTSGKNQRKSKRKFKGKSKKRSKRPQKPVVLTPEEFNDLYGLGDKIGSGAYGIVYRGLDKTTGAFLAVKEIYCGPDVVGGMTDVVTEVQILQRLRHPNIVRYVGAAVLWDRLYIFTEWVSGGSLTQIIAQFGQLPVGLVAQHTLQILKGLSYLHKQGIVHRDIKGQNILVSKDGRIKLADFGAARLLINITKGPALFGTPAFLAPEVITNERCDMKADIWSLGCTIIQMISGETPWALKGFSSVYELLHHVSTSNDSPPLENIPEREKTKDMIDFLERCFCRDPDTRATTKELFLHRFVCTRQESKPKSKENATKAKQISIKKPLKTQDSFDDSFNRSGALKIATAFFRKAKGGNPTTPLEPSMDIVPSKTNKKDRKKKKWSLVPSSSDIHYHEAADRRIAYAKKSPVKNNRRKENSFRKGAVTSKQNDSKVSLKNSRSRGNRCMIL
eukprot:g12980.t1